MRALEDIRADWDLADSNSEWGIIEQPEERLYNDIPDLLAALEAKNTEIARLKSDLAQSRTAIEKLSNAIWKVC